MKLKPRSAFLILTLAAASAACDDARRAPTAPTRGGPTVQPTGGNPNPNPAFHVAEVTLSGIVFENTPTGRQPIEGVRVANGEGTYATTDANGFYSLGPVWVCPCAAQPWIEAGTTFLWITKDGYTDPPGTPASAFGPVAGSSGTRDVKIDGDTRFDIELVRR